MKKFFSKKNKTSTSQLNDEEGSIGEQQESSVHQPDELEDPPYNIQRRANVRRSPSPQSQGTHEQIPQSQQGHESLHQATHSGPPQHTQPPPHVVGTSTGATAGTIDITRCKQLGETAGPTYNTLNETMRVTVQPQAQVPCVNTSFFCTTYMFLLPVGVCVCVCVCVCVYCVYDQSFVFELDYTQFC